MPNSSVKATPLPPAWRCAKSARSLPERSATSAKTRAASAGSGVGCCCADMLSGLRIADDAVGSYAARETAVGVQVVQVGHRLAHREEDLVRVERAAEQGPEDIGGGLR